MSGGWDVMAAAVHVHSCCMCLSANHTGMWHVHVVHRLLCGDNYFATTDTQPLQVSFLYVRVQLELVHTVW